MKFAAGMEHLQKKNPLNVFLYFKKSNGLGRRFAPEWPSPFRLLSTDLCAVPIRQTDLMFSDYKVRKISEDKYTVANPHTADADVVVL